MTAIASGRQASQRGMTLLELLIALTLLGLITVALSGGLRLGKQAWLAADDFEASTARVVAAQRLLRGLISSLPRPGIAESAISDSDGLSGTAEQIRFTGRLPRAAGLDGLFHIEIGLAPDGGEQALVARWWPPGADDEGLDASEQLALLSGVKSIRWRYLEADAASARHRWRESWSDGDILPALISLDVEFASPPDLVWPRLVVAPRTSR